MIDLYTKPELYDAIHSNYMWDEKIISKIGKRVGGPVLEIASGTGRLSNVIIKLGLEYTGIDLSKEYTKIAKMRYGNQGAFFVQNMQKFDLGTQFKFIFIGFNSFLHNLSNESALNCLKCINQHLSNNGTFLLSIYIPDPSFLYRDPNNLYAATDYFNFKDSKCRIMEKNLFNQETEINNLKWFLEVDGVLQEEEYNFSQKMYYPHVMDLLFEKAGLVIKEKLGDYDSSPMDQESNMQIYICGKS